MVKKKQKERLRLGLVVFIVVAIAILPLQFIINFASADPVWYFSLIPLGLLLFLIGRNSLKRRKRRKK